MAAVEGLIRACPQCGSEAFRALPSYSSPPWQIVECPSCTFVYLRNPPEYKHLVSDFAWEKTRVAEVEKPHPHVARQHDTLAGRHLFAGDRRHAEAPVHAGTRPRCRLRLRQ